jgi:glutamate-ammonia-ligase adenylyltransferase
LARSLGFADSPAQSAASRFDSRHKAVLSDVRGRFEKLFYRPMIESLAEGGRLSGDALRERLRFLGFRDVNKAVRTLEGLVSGTSRRAKLFRLITPAMLRHLAPTPLPDAGLFAFLRLGEVLENRPDALGALRDNPPGIEFLARILGSGRVLGEVLEHVPEELQAIADPAGPAPLKARDRMMREAEASLGWRDPDNRLDGLRRFKRREMLAVALADLGGAVDIAEVGASLADLADACLHAAVQDLDVQLGVVGMGKLGGRELNYSSDIDVLFIHDDDPGRAEKAAEELLRAIGEVTPEGQAFRIDANLRPEGKQGPLARTLESYLEYYGRWAHPWEHQALIKARASAGRTDLAQRLIDSTRDLSFPEVVRAESLAEIRHLKARMEKERVPRGTDPRRHMKMGPGGLADIEFAAQLLQIQNGARFEQLRVAGTRPALSQAGDLDLVPAADALRLVEAYDFLSKLRDRLYLMVGRPLDVLPTKPEDEEALGVAMGYKDQPRQELEEDYLRITRRARRVVEPLIYG